MRKKVAENTKRRRFKISEKQRAALRAVSVIILILVLLFMATETLGIASVSDMNDSIKNFFLTLSPGEGYPYKINSSSVEGMTVLNGDIFVLTDEKTLSLDTTAKQVKGAQHTFSNPIISKKGGKVVLFDQKGNRYRIENRTDTLYTGETPEPEKIITAALGKKGNLALATLSDSSVSKLTVLNNSYKKEEFVWNCANDSIVSVDLSDNGKYAAVSVVGARDGEIYSKVYIFDFAYSEPKAEFEYPGTAIIEVRFVSKDNVVALGNNMVSFIKNLKTKEDKSFESDTLSNYTFSDKGDLLLVLSEHGSRNSQILKSYSSSFSKNFEEKYTSSVKSIFAADGKVSVLLEDKVVVYKSSGSVFREYPADNTAISVMNIGNKTYVYAIGKIEKCSEKK